MSAVEMSSEATPLCMHCGSVMAPVMVRAYLPGQRFSLTTAFACEDPGCGCLYNVIHGYFEVRDGRISPIAGGIRVPCPVDESPMCIAETLGPTRRYKCCRRGCGGSTTL